MRNNMNSLYFLPHDIEKIILSYKEQLEIYDKYSNCINEIKNINYLTYSYQEIDEFDSDNEFDINEIHSVRAHIKEPISHQVLYEYDLITNFLNIYSLNSHKRISTNDYDDIIDFEETVEIIDMFEILQNEKERMRQNEERYQERMREIERLNREEVEEIKRKKEKIEYELSLEVERQTIQIYENNKSQRENKRKNNNKYKNRTKKLSVLNNNRRKNIRRKMKKCRKNCCKKYLKVIW